MGGTAICTNGHLYHYWSKRGMTLREQPCPVCGSCGRRITNAELALREVEARSE